MYSKDRLLETRTRVYPTPRQHEVFAFIVKFIADNNFSPTFKEIAAGVKLSKVSLQAVSKHLDGLEESGWIARIAGMPRSIVLRCPDDPESRRIWKSSIPPEMVRDMDGARENINVGNGDI